MRSGWLAKGVVYRERGHDEQGFDIIRKLAGLLGGLGLRVEDLRFSFLNQILFPKETQKESVTRAF